MPVLIFTDATPPAPLVAESEISPPVIAAEQEVPYGA